MKKPPKLKIPPQDLAMAAQFKDALEQAEDLPYDGRWAMTLELLPDSFLCYVVRARERRNNEDAMTFYVLLAMHLLTQWLDEEEIDETPDSGLISVALYGVMTSVYAELERRHKQFCDEVVHMPDPLQPNDPVQYIARDPDTFSIEVLSKRYQELCHSAPAGNKP